MKTETSKIITNINDYTANTTTTTTSSSSNRRSSHSSGNKPSTRSSSHAPSLVQKKDRFIDQPYDKMPFSLYDSNENYVKPKANIISQERTFSIVGSILDVPLPSDNDGNSEYSTFVNNIFNK